MATSLDPLSWHRVSWLLVGKAILGKKTWPVPDRESDRRVVVAEACGAVLALSTPTAGDTARHGTAVQTPHSRTPGPVSRGPCSRRD